MKTTINILACVFTFNFFMGQNNSVKNNKTETSENKVNWQNVYYYQVRKNDSLERVKQKLVRQQFRRDSLQALLNIKMDSAKNVLRFKRESLQNICEQLNSKGSEYYYYVKEIYRGYDTKAKFARKGYEGEIVDYQISRTSLFRNILLNTDGLSSGHTYYRDDIRTGEYPK